MANTEVGLNSNCQGLSVNTRATTNRGKTRASINGLCAYPDKGVSPFTAVKISGANSLLEDQAKN